MRIEIGDAEINHLTELQIKKLEEEEKKQKNTPFPYQDKIENAIKFFKEIYFSLQHYLDLLFEGLDDFTQGLLKILLVLCVAEIGLFLLGLMIIFLAFLHIVLNI